MSLDNRLNTLMEVISRPAFMENKGLGNEIGFYIFDYPAAREMLVREWVESTVQRANQGHLHFKVCCVDIFNIIIDVINEKGFYNKLLEMDHQMDVKRLLKPIRNTLRLNEGQDNLLVRKIQEALEPGNILFLTGVGKAFPIIRPHNLLNEMQAWITKNPVLLFFPGEYKDGQFTLFGKISSDNYYRGFKIVQ